MNAPMNPYREQFYEHVAACAVCQSISELCEFGASLFRQWRATCRGYEQNDAAARSEPTVARFPRD